MSISKMLVQRHRKLALPDLHESGVGLFHSETYKWGMASTATCECGAKEQTIEHVITSCPIYHYPNGVRALSDVNKNLATRLIETCPAI